MPRCARPPGSLTAGYVASLHCEQTFYRWKSKFGGMELSEAKRLRELEEENRRLKRLVADQALDIQILKEVNSKKW